MTFFPTIVSGPILRYSSFSKYLKKKEITAQSIAIGFRRFTVGLAKKVIIANQLSTLVNAAFDIHCKLSTPLAWLSSIAFMLQLYYDFSGYSDMAIGIGTMIGFEIPENFNYPYSSHSIQEFWQRWHMSLGSWFKDYVYIPLGGNRVSKVRWMINTMIVWALTGLWHGSTLMFVIWGIGHGLINIIEDAIHRLIPSYQKMKFLSPLRIFINFMLVSILWVFFKSGSMNEAISFFQSIFISSKITNTYLFEHISQNELLWTFVLLGIVIITDICRYYTDMITFLSKRIFIIRWLFYIVLILFAIVFGVYGPGYHAQDFIYVTF